MFHVTYAGFALRMKSKFGIALHLSSDPFFCKHKVQHFKRQEYKLQLFSPKIMAT